MNSISINKPVLFTNTKLIVIFALSELPFLFYLAYYYSSFIFLFPVIILFGILFFFALLNFDFWILSSIVAYIPLIAIKSEGISIAEIALAFYIFIPMGVWFFKTLFVQKKKIFFGIGDIFLLIFYLICLFSVVFTIINNFTVTLWFKEMIVFSGYLFYFPIREYFRGREEKLKKVLISFGILSFVTALYNLYQYRSKVALATQFFQVWSSRIGATEQVFMFCILIIISIIFLVKSNKYKLVLAGLLGLFFISLILSFTRSYLGFTFLGIFFLWVFFKKEHKIKLIFWVFLFSLIALGLMFLLFDNFAKLIFTALAGRFLGTKGYDISIIQRVIETEAILKQILANPITGWGLGATFRRYDLFYELHLMSYYAHNAYLYLWYKLGLLGLFSFLFVYFEKIIFCYKNYKNETNPLVKNILLVFIFMMISFIFISITSPQFYHKPSILILTIIWGFSESIRNKKTSQL